MNINQIAVVGAGLMGNGIAQSCAEAGYDVLNIDVADGAIDRAQASLQKIYNGKISRGKITEADSVAVLSRISYSDQYESLKDAHLIIEAVPEKIDIKVTVFSQLDEYADSEAVLVSNTSGLSISEMAAATTRPHKVMGAHFFYPAPVMKLVELVRGLATSDDTYALVKEFASRIGKTTVDAPELPGFMVNRMLVPMQNEAVFMVMEGCRPEDVDNAMKLGANHPMGPLELTDFVGVDIVLATMKGLYNGFGDSKYRPCPLLETMVKAGHLGRKSGQGFYTY